jgi:hypothetical protein
MERGFNNVSDDSKGFVIEIKDNTFMDIKNICLSEKARTLFKAEHILYLMILNMNRTNRIFIDEEFRSFVLGNVNVSRGSMFKIIKRFTESKMITKLEKRGWYRLNHVKTSIIKRDIELI